MKPLLAPSPMRIFVRGKLLSLSLSLKELHNPSRGCGTQQLFKHPSAFSRVFRRRRHNDFFFKRNEEREHERGTNLAKLSRGEVEEEGGSMDLPGEEKDGEFLADCQNVCRGSGHCPLGKRKETPG